MVSSALPNAISTNRRNSALDPCCRARPSARLAQIVDDSQIARKVGEQARQAALELAAPHAVAQELARCYAAIARVPALQHTGIYFPAPRLQRA